MIEKILERLREKFKYNSEQAEIWREGSDTDSYFREKKDLYLDRANTYGEAIEIVQEVAKDGGWIPCSERLPNWEIEDDYTEDVYTVLQWWDGDITYGIGWYRKNFGWSEDGANCKVIAWKPIAPYQKGE